MKMRNRLLHSLGLIYVVCTAIPLVAQTPNSTTEELPSVPTLPSPVPSAPQAGLSSDSRSDVELGPSNPSRSTDARSSVASDGTLRNEAELVLMSGPVHEAFAQQRSLEPTPGLLVAKEPPQLIDEIPPESRPLGNSIVWIPGYWGWDEQSSDFVWVTGLWRQSPPNRRWVPGYWNQVENGYQWISGFWADEQREEIAYLPPPPPPIDARPSTPAPGDNYFYVPGQWNFSDQQYQWRAGFWTPSVSNWIWVADSYVWTPRGCIYRSGYWDYQLANRGTLFCPMQFGYAHAGLRYQPQYVLNTGVNWFANLFVYPAYRHYYFGNYYGQQYRQHNIVPWIAYGQSHRYDDPFYSNYYAGNRQILRQIDDIYQRNEHNSRQDWPRSFADLNSNSNQGRDSNVALFVQAASIGALVSNGQDMRRKGWDTKFDYSKVESDFTRRTLEGRDAFRELVQQRTQIEPQGPLNENARRNLEAQANTKFRDNTNFRDDATVQGNAKTQQNARVREKAESQASADKQQRDESQDAKQSKLSSDVLRLPKSIQNAAGSSSNRNSDRPLDMTRGTNIQPSERQTLKPNVQGQGPQPLGNQPSVRSPLPTNPGATAGKGFLNQNLMPRTPNSNLNPAQGTPGVNASPGNPILNPNNGRARPNVQSNPAPNIQVPNPDPGRNASPRGPSNSGKEQGKPEKRQGNQGKGRNEQGDRGKQK